VKYALMDGIKQEATPEKKRILLLCNNPTISKCGS
jgi:hypothetical protein